MPDDENETIDEKVERLVNERLAASDAERQRADKIKKAGLSPDILDVIADAVWDRGEQRAAGRAKAAEDADQAPTTAKRKGGGNFLQTIGLVANDD